MSGKWPGGFIKKTAPTVVGPTDGEGGTASGIWTLDQAADYEKQGLWPKPVLPRELWVWGRNQFGQLGQGTSGATNYSSPVQVGSLTDWLKLAGSQYYGILTTKSDGTAWSWGAGASGQLGQGSITNYSSPVQIGALTDWTKSISMGFYSPNGGIKSDGTLWLWGTGSYGALAQGNTTNYSSPVQVGALTTWLQFSAGYYFGGAVQTDNTLWTWGRSNNYGQLGHNNKINYSSPKQVGALTNWLEVSIGHRTAGAIKTDGTLWMWGRNDKGQVGDGSITDRSSPVQIGALTTWSKLESAYEHTLALKTDGTLWAWGNNNTGQLGQGNTTNYSSPVQIGALTNWSQISGAIYSSMALTTAGTIFGWGWNTKGQLGVGDITNRSSPTQVGALTTWTLVMASNYQGGGIKTV